MDPFLLNYDADEIRIAAEFLTNWLPFLSRDLCKSCTQKLSDGIRSLDTGVDGVVSTPKNADQGNCACSTDSAKGSAENNDDDTHSLGSWKDEADCLSEYLSESSSTNAAFNPTAPPSIPTTRKSLDEYGDTRSLSSGKDGVDCLSPHPAEASPTSAVFNPPVPPSRPTVRKSWADMAIEDELAAEEDNELSSDSSATTKSVFEPKATLSRDQREYIRFRNVQRKKDFICLERVNGKIVNILDGLELHRGVFSAAEQKRIVSYVEQLQEMGRNGKLKEHTYTAPQKWMRGKGRVTLQFGCCYNYATDKNGNPPGILKDDIVDPLPDLFKVMVKRLVRWHVLPSSCVPDSCIVNIYEEGDCIPPHIDNHDFVRPFSTVSFLSECEILFGSNLKIAGAGEFTGSYAISLPVGSVLVLNGKGADVAKHCVPAVPTKRISITFRKMDDAKRPNGYIPDPDLQGLLPLPDEVNRSKKHYASRSRSSFTNPVGGRENGRDKWRGPRNPDTNFQGRVSTRYRE